MPKPVVVLRRKSPAVWPGTVPTLIWPVKPDQLPESSPRMNCTLKPRVPEPVRVLAMVPRGGMLITPLWPAATVIGPVSVPQLVPLSVPLKPLRFSTPPFWNAIGPVPMPWKPLGRPPARVTVPPARVSPPVYAVLAPASTSVPEPDFVISPAPVTTPLSVSVSASPGTSIPPPAAVVTTREVVKPAVVRSVPPSRTTPAAVPASPRLVSAATLSTPPLTVVWPV